MRHLFFAATAMFIFWGYAEADAAPILLNCSVKCIANCSGPVQSLPVTLHINKSNRTVMDGDTSYKANFGETLIVWHEADVVRFNLNRSTLTLTEAFNRLGGNDFSGALFQGPCKKGTIQI